MPALLLLVLVLVLLLLLLLVLLIVIVLTFRLLLLWHNDYHDTVTVIVWLWLKKLQVYNLLTVTPDSSDYHYQKPLSSFLL